MSSKVRAIIDGEEKFIDAPILPAPTPQPKTWPSARAFMEEFLIEERVAIREYAKSDVLVEDFLDLLRGANYISAVDPLTIQGLQYLVTNQVLSAERVAEVLGT